MSMIENPDLHAMDIAQLRKYASHARVAVAKTATKEDILEAIERKLSGRVIPHLADENSKVKPGYAKIRVMSDPSPGSSNLPVYLNCNTSTFLIPRDVDVIVPMRVVRTLNDATTLIKKQVQSADANGREQFRETTVKTMSYPFTVLEMNPGPEVLNAFEMSKIKIMAPRRRYRDLFGHWPRGNDVNRAIEQGLIKLHDDEEVPEVSNAIL